MNHVLTNAKAYVALVGMLAAALLQQFGPEGDLGVVLTTIVTVTAVFGVWATPNAD